MGLAAKAAARASAAAVEWTVCVANGAAMRGEVGTNVSRRLGERKEKVPSLDDSDVEDDADDADDDVISTSVASEDLCFEVGTQLR